MSIATWLLSRVPITEAEVRTEIWSLGSRHLGWPLEGALRELAEPGLAADRARLLRACVRKLQRG